MKRRAWVLGTAAWATLRASREATAEARNLTLPHAFTLRVDAARPGVPINRMLLGQNVQWTYGGDGLMDRSGKWRTVVLDKFRALHPTSLRFPGGSQADVYRWKYGMGPLAGRQDNVHFFNREPQPSVLGTQELLELCEMVDARPFFTVNTVTGSPEEAADWLRLTNKTGLVSRRTGNRLPSVPYWEIGNEPYLKDGHESQRVAPDVFMQRANAFIRALRAVDPQVLIGVPLRTAKVAGLPATPYPDFAHDVLTRVAEPFDFISNHNAYMPYLFDMVPDDISLFWGVMGATATVARNLDETRELARALRPGWKASQAITEYNALFSLGKGGSDDLVVSQAGAMYVADVLRMLAERDDILLAQFWSLSGNWKFGAIAESGYERPGYLALRLVEEAFRGGRLPAAMACGRFDSPRVGAAAEARGVPLVASLVSREGAMLRVLLINKDIDRIATGRLALTGAVPRAARLSHVTSNSPLRAGDREQSSRRTDQALGVDAASGVSFQLPAASVALLTVELQS